MVIEKDFFVYMFCAFAGLKKFCKVAPLLNSSKSRFDIVDRYLSAFPDGKTIIQYFNVRHYGMAVVSFFILYFLVQGIRKKTSVR